MAEAPAPRAPATRQAPERDVVRLYRTFYAGARPFGESRWPARAASRARRPRGGRGRAHVRLRDGDVEDVRLADPRAAAVSRALLRGRRVHAGPDITARICGICLVAYQMSSIAAMEDVCGVEVPEPVRVLRPAAVLRRVDREPCPPRRLLHARTRLPRRRSGSRWRATTARIVERALQLKKAGNSLMRVVGGREIHPVNVRVGGFYRAPTRAELSPVVEELEVAPASSRASRWHGRPACRARSFEEDFEFVALRAPDTYAIESGRLASSSGLDLAPAEYEEHFAEHQVPHSTALHSRLRDGRAYLTGPLARYALSGDRLSPVAREAADGAGLGSDVPQPVQEHRRARGRDPVRASTRRSGCSTPTTPPTRRPSPSCRAPAPASAGRGAARDALAPLRDRRARARSSTRGSSRPPARTRRASSRASPPSSPRTPRSRTTSCSTRCEQAVRSFDPCISCATHFLRLEVERC